MTAKAILYEPDTRIRRVYFPVDSLVSVVTVMRDGDQVEAFTIGREGMTGAQPLLDFGRASTLTTVQVGGVALEIPFDALRRLADESPSLRTLIERYIGAQLDVMAQSIACNRLHVVSARCARWLLLTSNRLGRETFELTHESLSTMLGVRRAGVTEALAALEHTGAIAAERGRIGIVDREALAQAACECYAANIEAFRGRGLPHG